MVLTIFPSPGHFLLSLEGYPLYLNFSSDTCTVFVSSVPLVLLLVLLSLLILNYLMWKETGSSVDKGGRYLTEASPSEHRGESQLSCWRLPDVKCLRLSLDPFSYSSEQSSNLLPRVEGGVGETSICNSSLNSTFVLWRYSVKHGW